jgi:hypothetical protein
VLELDKSLPWVDPLLAPLARYQGRPMLQVASNRDVQVRGGTF